MSQERKAAYDELRDARLAMVSEQKKQATQSQQKGKDVFAKRQKERLAAEKAEKDRLKKWRLESLEKNKADLHMDMREGEPGYGPKRWCWPTAYHHPRHWGGPGEDVSVDFPPAKEGRATFLPPGGMLGEGVQPGGAEGSPSTLLELVSKVDAQLEDMKKREAQMRLDTAKGEAEAEALAKKEREEAAKKMRDEVTAKEAAKSATERARVKQIKKEMAIETAKAHKDEATREKIRLDKSHAERTENVKKLMTDMRLRSEIEIANERREGSPMSKGGKTPPPAKPEGDEM